MHAAVSPRLGIRRDLLYHRSF